MAKNIEFRGVDEVILNRGYKPIGVDVDAALIFKKHVVGSEKTALKDTFSETWNSKPALAIRPKSRLSELVVGKGEAVMESAMSPFWFWAVADKDTTSKKSSERCFK